MKAAVLTQLNAPLEICDLVHNGPEFGQVLVKILQSGICGAQLAEIRGEKNNARFLPHLLGHEAVGEVLLVGRGVTRVKVGDKVICHWRKAAGNEAVQSSYFRPSDEYQSSPIKGGAVTTFASEALISENRLTPIADDVPNDLAALLGCGLSTALGTIENEADLKFGETVLIIGCGGLGANLILAAKLRQASYIVATDIEPTKMEFAYAMGASLFYGPGAPLATRFDVIIDTTGSQSAVRDAFPLLASGGRFILVGQPKPGFDMVVPDARDLFAGEGKRIIATQGGQFRPDKDIPRYVAMWRAGLLKLDGLVTHRIPLERINEGLDLVSQGQAGRVMVTM